MIDNNVVVGKNKVMVSIAKLIKKAGSSKLRYISVGFIVHTFIDDESNNDYTAVDALVERMNLTQGEYDVLCAYMSGLTYLEVTQLLKVNRTTIWRRRMKLQEKFLCT